VASSQVGQYMMPVVYCCQVSVLIYSTAIVSYPMVQQPLVGQGLLIIEAPWSHSDTPHLVGVLWMSNQPDTETSTWQHTTLTTDGHPRPRRDSNPQSQKVSSRRAMPWTAWPLELAYCSLLSRVCPLLQLELLPSSTVPLRHLDMRKNEVLHIVLDQYRQIFVYHYLKML
jgi:hypothetical protein